MGGVVILVAITVTTLVLVKPNPACVVVLSATLLTGLLGLVDDLSKVVKERSLGLEPHSKLIWQALISVAFCLFAVNMCGIEPVVTEVFSHFTIDLGVLTTTLVIGGLAIRIPWLYVLFVFVLMAGLSNAVNLTDGLDGLAIMPVMIAAEEIYNWRTLPGVLLLLASILSFTAVLWLGVDRPAERLRKRILAGRYFERRYSSLTA